ncbi:MAG TPA: NAD(P)-dependent oxidoreductase [Pseudonocardiaceae bacterium]|jgi:3-hydroxyisobutyrate dehydrogenase|nr:NAD(P)-dependent oxidoreductase [Pseudonocardiaceae bacterium]
MTALPAGATIAFVGLGNMGTPMSGHLVDAGFRVQGFDVSADARARLAEHGGVAAADLGAAVATATVVVLMLPDSGVVERVLRDEQAVRGLPSGTVVVDMSSSEPLRTKDLAVELAERGVSLVDAPVSGGVARARTGKLTIMAGGDAEVIAELGPLFGPLGTVTHTGPVGAGHAIKALNNLLSATHLLATAEAMQAGERFGLDPEVMLAVINSSSGRSGSTENKWPNFVLTEKYDSGFGLRLMLKDMRIAVGLAERVGAPSRLSADAVELWAQAAEALPDSADHTELARWVRALADQETD